MRQPTRSLQSRLAGLLLIALLLLPIARPAAAVTPPSGQSLFQQHCAGCHINGGNIIRRGKTLKLNALERAGLADPQAIARVAAEGIGQMSGYGEVLGSGGAERVGEWVWQQAQNAWIQG
ncbi:cytochrome C [Synechococcus sp. RSCCF101]|uniref:c-type cytochrome n=1 Tax=Synechococcus sp. RSCCF101 TaxID=2511069 RepID=UPI001243A037|nr:c-type cytochrome [Synechococcus sp. RSCCF101]QEY32061.1 cytochrome C [Synechococcus sp. RSCCF101]